MKKPITLCLALLAAGFPSISCFAQNEAFDIKLLPAKKGGVLAFSGKKYSFTVQIASDSIQTTDNPNYLTVDNQILMVSCVQLPNGADLSGYIKDQQKITLNSYADYELAYFQKELKMPVKNLKKEWMIIQDRLYLQWQYDMSVPKDNKVGGQELKETVTHQIFLSAILHDQILDINTPLMKSNNAQKARKLIYDVAASLKTYDKPLDIPALAQTLQ